MKKINNGKLVRFKYDTKEQNDKIRMIDCEIIKHGMAI